MPSLVVEQNQSFILDEENRINCTFNGKSHEDTARLVFEYLTNVQVCDDLNEPTLLDFFAANVECKDLRIGNWHDTNSYNVEVAKARYEFAKAMILERRKHSHSS